MSLQDSISQGIVWRDGAVVDEPITADMITKAQLDKGLLVWIDLENPNHDDLAVIAKQMDLPPPTIEDVTASHERPKLTQHKQTFFLTLYGTSRKPPSSDPLSTEARLETYRLSTIVTDSVLITIRTRPDVNLAPVFRRWDDTASVLKTGGVFALLHGLLDYSVDSYTGVIESIDDDLDGLEGVLFGAAPLGRSFLTELYVERKDLRHLRRIVLPMKDLVHEVVRRRGRDGTDLDQWYDDLVDHSSRVVDWSDSLRDSMGTMFETSLSLQDAKLNVIMKKLAGWGAIIAVPTFITGWYGQNVPFWGDSKPWGVWMSVFLVIGSTIVLYLQFKKRDWL